jgi:branched-chain amino acid transport system ATP-binding protein
MAAVSLLATRGLTRRFGGLTAVDGVDLDLAPGEIRARIAPSAGEIRFDGRDITRLPALVRVALGIAYTFLIAAIYARLPVFDNVALAVQRRGSGNLATETMAALDRVGLADRADQTAGTLAYGHQRLLEVAMGLALAPKLLILDEPTQGLAPGEIDAFKTLVRDVARTATVLLIEHNMDVVMDLAHRITVLDFGRILAEGTPAQVRADPAVQAAYLGA